MIWYGQRTKPTPSGGKVRQNDMMQLFSLELDIAIRIIGVLLVVVVPEIMQNVVSRKREERAAS